MPKYKRAFITGSDEKTEWMIPWFIGGYKVRNDTPIVFVDFGVSSRMRQYVGHHFNEVIDLPKDLKKQDLAWFYKPAALSIGIADEKVWIDTDCEVLGDLSGIFDHLELNKLAMVQDLPWTTRRNEIWHNTGVVGCIGNPPVLRQWLSNCQNPGVIPADPNLPPPGDQDVLHHMIGPDPMKRMIYITDLPNKYNVVRIQHLDGTVPRNPLVLHWTGYKGKNEIKLRMNK